LNARSIRHVKGTVSSNVILGEMLCSNTAILRLRPSLTETLSTSVVHFACGRRCSRKSR